MNGSQTRKSTPVPYKRMKQGVTIPSLSIFVVCFGETTYIDDRRILVGGIEVDDLFEHVRSRHASLKGVSSNCWLQVTLHDDEHDSANRLVSVERQFRGHRELLNQCIGFFGK